MTRFIRFLLEHRALVGALLLASVLLAAYSARRIEMRFQFRDFYDYPANQQLELFKRDNQEFGDPAGYVVAMLEADDVFRPDVIAYVRRLTRALEPEPVFARIRSLTNAPALRGRADDLVKGPLFPESASEAELAEARHFALESPLIRRRLVSRDGTATAVLAEMRKPALFADIDEQREAIRALERVIARNPPPSGVHLRVTGAPPVEVGVTEALVRDQAILMPAVLSVLALFLFVTFRSFHGVLLSMTSVSVATLWTAGVYALFERPVDIIGSVIPTTILVYGVVDPIFVLTRVFQKLDAGRTKHDAIVEALSELALPCFLTSLATAFGFAVFVSARALTIRYYGMSVAIGVMLAWLASVTVLPLLLSIVRTPRRSFSTNAVTSRLDRVLVATWRFLRGRVSQAIATIFVLLGLSVWFARSQQIDNVYVGALPRGEILDGARTLEKKLAGVLRVIVYLEGEPGVMQQPAVLKAIESIDRGIEREPVVTLSSSLSDLVGEANQAFLGGDSSERRVPDSARLIAQYLALVDPADRSDFVTDDYSRSHIALLLEDRGSQATRELVGVLRESVERAGLAAYGVKASLTGNGIVGYDELDGVVVEILYGFITAFSVVILLEWLVFRSLRIALISVVPNLVPVVACFLALRLFDLRLRIDSALVLCISIGGLFNTTIHFAARVQQRVREAADSPDAVIEHAMRSIGPPSFFTALVLSVGFAVLLLSSFPGLRALGLLTMIALVSGFLADMLITPVLMRAGFAWRARTEPIPVPAGTPSPAPGHRSDEARVPTLR